MNWTFKIQESSNGAYSCEGMRSTGNAVSLVCDEGDIFRVYQDAYELEMALGTSAGRAAFLVVEGAKPAWTAEYAESTFGSWVVTKPNGSARIVFDGRDFILMAYGTSDVPQWQGYVGESEPPNRKFFEFLFRA